MCSRSIGIAGTQNEKLLGVVWGNRTGPIALITFNRSVPVVEEAVKSLLVSREELVGSPKCNRRCVEILHAKHIYYEALNVFKMIRQTY